MLWEALIMTKQYEVTVEKNCQYTKTVEASTRQEARKKILDDLNAYGDLVTLHLKKDWKEITPNKSNINIIHLDNLWMEND